MGLGMGFLSTSAIVIIQDSVGWAERGAATASNIFSRNLGSTLGATVLGGVLNYSLAHRAAGSARSTSTRSGSCSTIRALVAGDAAVRDALASALHLTFWAVFLIALSTLLAALLVPSVALVKARQKVAAE